MRVQHRKRNVPPAEFGREPSSVASVSLVFLPKHLYDVFAVISTKFGCWCCCSFCVCVFFFHCFCLFLVVVVVKRCGWLVGCCLFACNGQNDVAKAHSVHELKYHICVQNEIVKIVVKIFTFGFAFLPHWFLWQCWGCNCKPYFQIVTYFTNWTSHLFFVVRLSSSLAERPDNYIIYIWHW